MINLVVASLAVLAPVAHALELPNKLSLDANLWLAVQQHLYRGWGPLLGAPTEIGGLVTSAALAWVRRRQRFRLSMTLIACLGYAGMLVSFFVLNSPVNFAVSSWTPTMMPPDWPSIACAGNSVMRRLPAVRRQPDVAVHGVSEGSAILTS
jgi:hypothetical protein